MTVDSAGMFIVSLDFELYWGVHDHVRLPEYAANLQGVHTVVPKILSLFEQYGIHATWATVGFLFLDSLRALQDHVPTIQPAYTDPTLNPYTKLAMLASIDPQLLFASQLIERILAVPHQEIGTHTFSHYYCLEAEQCSAAFCTDLAMAITVARKQNLVLESMVFPRNQINQSDLTSCFEYGIRTYRGTEQHWMYRSRPAQQQTLFIRFWRLLDAYFNLTSHHCSTPAAIAAHKPYNIPASRFLRPYNPHLEWLEPFRLRRITSSMAYAARHGKVFHLWWHPHNFGIHQNKNLAVLRHILEHYTTLQQAYGFQSRHMAEVANYIERHQNEYGD